MANANAGLRVSDHFNITKHAAIQLAVVHQEVRVIRDIGSLFREITSQTVELSVTERIWGLIQQLVSAVAELFSADFDEILTNIIYKNKQLNVIMEVVQQLQPVA